MVFPVNINRLHSISLVQRGKQRIHQRMNKCDASEKTTDICVFSRLNMHLSGNHTHTHHTHVNKYTMIFVILMWTTLESISIEYCEELEIKIQMHTCTNIKSDKNPFEMWWKCSWAHILCSVRKIDGTVKYKLRNKRWKKTQLWKCDGDWQAIWDSGAMHTAHSTEWFCEHFHSFSQMIRFASDSSALHQFVLFIWVLLWI